MTDHERFKVRQRRKQDMQRRLAVYAEIDRLELKRCDNCRGMLGRKQSIEQMNCDCAAATRVRELTKLLTSSHRKKHPNHDGMTVDKYQELKKQGLTDREIAGRVPQSLTTFNKWKKENGLSNAWKSLKGVKS